MTHRKLTVDNGCAPLLLAVPDTNLKNLLQDALNLIQRKPEILDKIRHDQDALAKKKKSQRLQNKRYIDSWTEPLQGIEVNDSEIIEDDLVLDRGCPRMDPELVFVLLVLRGYYGSLCSTRSVERMRDSMTLHNYLQGRQWKLPARSTIIDNINTVSNETREFIFRTQLEMIIDEKLDDFKKVTVDSTSVFANSEWPTDAGILLKLLQRVYRIGQKLHRAGFEKFQRWWVPQWLKSLAKLLFKMNNAAGKANSKKKLKKYYRQFLEIASKAIAFLKKEWHRVYSIITPMNLSPCQRQRFQRLFTCMQDDLDDAQIVSGYASERIFGDIISPVSEKILSTSDSDASYIKKGNRNPLIGYKNQIMRSGNGFVSALRIPRGNVPDCKELLPMVTDTISNTGIIPDSVSTDDGYASAKGRDSVLGLGVKILSISGAKGKKLTADSDWDHPIYQEIRRYRSAVESIIFTLKHSFEFGRLRRRGIDDVKAEQLEKVIAFNFCRMTYIRELQAAEKDKRLPKAA